MSVRAPQRCVKCSQLTGIVVLRRGHQCPLAVRPHTAVGPPTALHSTSTPSISIPDVHQLDIEAIGNLGPSNIAPRISTELFDFSNLDLEGPTLAPNCSSDLGISWMTGPPPDIIDTPTLEFTSEGIFQFLETFNANTNNNGDSEADVDDDFNFDIDPDSIDIQNDPLFDPAVEHPAISSNEHSDTSSSTELDTSVALDSERPESESVLLTTMKTNHRKFASLSKVSKGPQKEGKVYTLIKDPKKRKKRFSGSSIRILKLIERLYAQTGCYVAVVFAGVDSIAAGRTKSYFSPNLTSSEAARAVLEGCSQQLGDLMTQQWHLSQVDHSLQIDGWRNKGAGIATNQ